MTLYILIAFLAIAHGSVLQTEVHQPQPYSFGYTVRDHGGVQHRQEAGNGAGMVKGSYGYTDSKGIQREVDYVADHGGFRAQVKTNEPGTAAQNPAAVQMMVHNPYGHGYYGFPTIYGHRAQGYPLPALDRYKFMTPIREPAHHMSLQHHEQPMPLQHHEHHMPIHVPLHEHVAPHHQMAMISPAHEQHHAPLHMPSHHLGHHMPVQMPLLQHMPHQMPAQGQAPAYMHPLHHMP